MFNLTLSSICNFKVISKTPDPNDVDNFMFVKLKYLFKTQYIFDVVLLSSVTQVLLLNYGNSLIKHTH